MIKYITGRAGSGKSHYIIEEIKKKLSSGAENVYVIVPDQYTYETEKQLVSALGGLMYVEVLSLNRLINKILQAAGGAKEHYVSDQGRAMLIFKAISEGRIEFSVLKKAARDESFLKNMSELIANFKRFCVQPEDLLKVIDDIEDEITKEKLTDIAKVYAALETVIAPYKDSGDMLIAAAEAAQKADFLRGAHVYIDGFETTASAMYVITKALLGVCESVNITFNLGQGEDEKLFSIEKAMLQGFRKTAEELGEMEEIVYLPLAGQILPERNEELLEIESQYFAYPFKMHDKAPKNVKVYMAENTIKEAEYISRRALEFIRDKGYACSDIAIIVPQINEQGPIVARALRENGIEYYMDEKKSIYESPLPQFILKSISISKKGYNSEDMLALIKTGLVCEDEAQYDMCHYITEKGIDRYRFNYPFEEYRGIDLEEIREKLVSALDEFTKSTKKALSYEHLAKAVYKLLNDLEIQKKIQEQVEALRSLGEEEIASVQTQCYNECMVALDNAVLYLANTEVSIGSFVSILKAGFSMVEIGVIPAHGDAVLIGDIKRSMPGEIKALFIMGCQEGILPRVPDSGLLLNDDDVGMLKEAGIVAGNDGSYIEAQDDLSLYRALSKPNEYLYVSYALKDAGEKILRPSSIISRIKELFPLIKEETFSKEERMEHITAPMPTAARIMGELRRYIETGEMAEEFKEAYRQLRAMPIKQTIDIGEQALYYDGVRKRQATEPISTLSASRIETYALCPFKYFSQYLIRPVVIEPYELTPLNQGNFFHRCLELFTKECLIGKDMASYDEERIKKEIRNIIEKTENESEYLALCEDARNRYMIKHAGQLAFNTALSIYKYFGESSFKAKDSEFVFKGENGYKISEGTKLEGKIDRVDVFKKGNDAYYSIIDYKSSAKDIDFSEVYSGLSLQPLLYMNALIESEKNKGANAHAAGAFYVKVDDPIVSVSEDLSDIDKVISKKFAMSGVRLGEVDIADALDPKRLYIPGDRSQSTLSEKELMALSDFAKEKAAGILKGIEAGVCDIVPIVKKDRELACKYCYYKEICGYDEGIHTSRPVVKIKKDRITGAGSEAEKDEQ